MLTLILTFAASLSQAAPTHLVRVDPLSIPEFAIDGNLQSFQLALERQIQSCKRLNLNEKRTFSKRTVTRKEWCIDTAQEYLNIIRSSTTLTEVQAQARKTFEWYRSIGRDQKGEVFFTGYNSPTLRASRTPTERFRFPLYKKPSNLVQVTVNRKTTWKKRLSNGSLVPFDTRKEIDQNGSLKNQSLEIGYVEDLYSTFVFQVQGAGTLEFEQPDGSIRAVFLNYAAENGQSYVQIRKVMQNLGIAEEYLTIPGQRRYFSQHPDQLLPILTQNPSYVFFKETHEGPYGVDTILLTTQHSIAVDRSVFPTGAIGFIHSEKPILEGDQVKGWTPFAWLVINQDTGGSIKGPGRVDTFWGDDSVAETTAGVLGKTGGLYYALKLKKKVKP